MRLEVPIALRQIAAFIKRDFYTWTTYKTAMVTQLINIFIGVFAFGGSATYLQRPVNSVSYTHLTLPTTERV